MKCLEQPYELWGDFDSTESSNLMIVFELCDQAKRDDCEEDEKKIHSWMKSKYLFVQQNEQTYDQSKDSDDRIRKESMIIQHALSADTRADFPRFI